MTREQHRFTDWIKATDAFVLVPNNRVIQNGVDIYFKTDRGEVAVIGTFTTADEIMSELREWFENRVTDDPRTA